MFTMPRIQRFEVAVALLVLVSAARAQVPTAVLRSSDPLGQSFPGQSVTAIHAPLGSQDGGWAAHIESRGASGSLDHVYGAPSIFTTASVLQTPGVVGGLIQDGNQTTSGGITGDGMGAYGAHGTGGPLGAFVGAFLDSKAIAVMGDPSPAVPGHFWGDISRVGGSEAGDVEFWARLASTPGGSPVGEGLFRGVDPVALSGDVVPGLGGLAIASTNAIGEGSSFSPSGARWLSGVRLDGASPGTDGVILDTGLPVLAGSGMLREGELLADGIGGLTGETWHDVLSGKMVSTDTGAWAAGAGTSGSVLSYEVLLVNGMIALREGDVLDHTGNLKGPALALDMNESGDWASLWKVNLGNTEATALIVNAEDTDSDGQADTGIVLMEGDSIDLDGDGLLDNGTTLEELKTEQLVMGAFGSVYVAGRVDIGGTPNSPDDDIEALIQLRPCQRQRDDVFDTAPGNDTCANASSVVEDTYNGLFVSVSDPDWYVVTVDPGLTVSCNTYFSSTGGDVDIELYDSCSATSTLDASLDTVGGFERVITTNTSGIVQDYYIKVLVKSGSLPLCNSYRMTIGCTLEDTQQIGTSYCTGNPNSTGFGARITAHGSTSVTDNHVVLRCQNLPLNQFGVFFFGQSQNQNSFGNGTLCVSQPIIRLGNKGIDDEGTVCHDLDIEFQGMIVAGSQQYFQFWYRDPQGGGSFFNLSDGVQITFQ